MRTAVGARNNHSLKQKGPVGKIPASRRNAQKEDKMPPEEKMTEAAHSAGKLFTFTIDASTAQVVKLEALDDSGVRHELSDDEKASLAQATAEAGVEQFVEKAFEAGIACVLGDDERQDKAAEPADEAELRRLLLAPLIQYSPAMKLMQREVLDRAILGTLIQHATKAAPPPPTVGSQAAAPVRAN